MTERKTELDEAIERAAAELTDHLRFPDCYCVGCIRRRADIIHKHIDPLVTLPEDVKLPVEVIYLPVTAAHQHLLAPCLGFDLQIAADIINRIAKEKG